MHAAFATHASQPMTKDPKSMPSGTGATLPASVVPAGEPPFPCPYPNCNQRFRQRYGLKVHSRKHTGHAPYKCRVPGCDYRGKWRSSLRHHTRQHARADSAFAEAAVIPTRSAGVQSSTVLDVASGSQRTMPGDAAALATGSSLISVPSPRPRNSGCAVTGYTQFEVPLHSRLLPSAVPTISRQHIRNLQQTNDQQQNEPQYSAPEEKPKKRKLGNHLPQGVFHQQPQPTQVVNDFYDEDVFASQAGLPAAVGDSFAVAVAESGQSTTQSTQLHSFPEPSTLLESCSQAKGLEEPFAPMPLSQMQLFTPMSDNTTVAESGRQAILRCNRTDTPPPFPEVADVSPYPNGQGVHLCIESPQFSAMGLSKGRTGNPVFAEEYQSNPLLEKRLVSDTLSCIESDGETTPRQYSLSEQVCKETKSVHGTAPASPQDGCTGNTRAGQEAELNPMDRAMLSLMRGPWGDGDESVDDLSNEYLGGL